MLLMLICFFTFDNDDMKSSKRHGVFSFKIVILSSINYENFILSYFILFNFILFYFISIVYYYFFYPK